MRVAADIADRILVYGICVPVAARLRENVISSMRVAADIADRILVYGICVPVAARLRGNVISSVRATDRLNKFKKHQQRQQCPKPNRSNIAFE